MKQQCNQYRGSKIGNFNVCCGGLCIKSPDFLCCLVTIFLIVAPSILQILFAHSAYPSLTAQILVDIFYIISILVNIVLLMVASCTDPGIIPRKEKEENSNGVVNLLINNRDTGSGSLPQGDDQQLVNASALTIENQRISQEQSIKPNHQSNVVEPAKLVEPALVKEYYTIIAGKEIILSYCKTCNIRRPPRTFHCSRCNACIETHDHHCPWVGTCIGKRNHKYFVMFLTYTSLHCLFTLATGVPTLLNSWKVPFAEDMIINFPCWIITIFGAFMFVVLFPFGMYHWYLISTGRTTNEEVRGKYHQWKGNPFNLGCRRNCRSQFYGGRSKVLNRNSSSLKVEDEQVNAVFWEQYEIFEREVQPNFITANLDLDID